MDDDGTGMVSFRVEDPELADALADAEDEHGSKSEAVRSALRDSLLGSGEVAVSDINGRKVPQKAVEAHRKLVEYTGVGGRIGLDTAESILANHLNIQKEAVRRVVIKPLRGAGVVGISQGISHVSIVVGAEGTPASDEGWAQFQAAQEHHTAGEKIDDPSEASDRLDELAEAVDGGESA